MNLLTITLVMSLLIGQTQNHDDIRAQLLRVFTDIPEESGWWVVPSGVNKMNIYAESKNTETVLFWLIPTGTQTWRERELIGYDKDVIFKISAPNLLLSSAICFSDNLASI